MKKITKITALLLSFVMLFAFTASASSTLLLVEKFNYTDAAAFFTALGGSNTTKLADNGSNTNLDLAALRTAGTLMGRTGTFSDQVTNGSTMGTNSRGNGTYLSGNTSSNNHAYFWLLPTSWTAPTDGSKSLIVSFENDYPQELNATYSSSTNGVDILGYDATEAKYQGATGMNFYASKDPGTGAVTGFQYCYVKDGGSYTDARIAETTGTDTHAIKYTYNATEGHIVRDVVAYDGTKAWSSGYSTAELPGFTTIDGVSLMMSKHLPSYANLKIYTIDNNEGLKVSSTVNGQEIDKGTSKITLKFTQPLAIEKFSSDSISIKEGDADFTNYTVGTLTTVDSTVGSDIYSEVDITFPDGLNYDKTYTLTVNSAVCNEVGDVIDADNSSITFTTEAAPTFTMTLNAYAGLNDNGAAWTGDTAGTVYFKATATYKEGKAVANGLVKIAVCDDAGNVVKYAAAKKALDGSATFAAALKVKAGQTVKAFVDGALGEAAIND